MTDKQPGVLEAMAALEHDRWSRWMRWMFDNWTDENIARWKRQMVTDYASLPEHSKESDRKEARAALTTVLDHMASPSEGMYVAWIENTDNVLAADATERDQLAACKSDWQAMLSQFRDESLGDNKGDTES